MSTITRFSTPFTGAGDQLTKPKAGLRPDIQGLRAIAVLAVIFDHLFHWPSGGFVGVDVFFVISGFLITGLLIREHDRTGRISFADFYRRRIKRIVPAAMTVVIATSLAAYFLFSTARSKDVLIDAVWATFFSANWRFVTAGTDYFDAAGAVSPLQHFWSLAVEEQFYFVWPWLMLLIFFVVSRRKGRQRSSIRAAHLAIGVAMALIVVASFAWAVRETLSQPTWAYFSTFSRAWELGVGALLAVGAATLNRIPDTIRPVLAWLGLAGIGFSLFAVTADSLFPAPWAALPVLSAALVIAAGTGGPQKFLWPLTNRAMGYVGDISYSLYLWHFPLIVFLALVLPEGVTFFAAVLVATFALAAASYHAIENPVRKSQWLEPGGSRKRKKRRNARVTKILVVAGVSSLAVLTLVVTTVALTRTAPQDQPVAVGQASPLSEAGGATAASDTAVAAHTAAISTALQATSWPELSPSIDQLGREQLVPEWAVEGCLGNEMNSQGDPAANSERCVFGDPGAAKTAVVLGDSMSISYVSGIRAALEPQGYKVHVITLMQCPAFSLTVIKADRSEHPDCDPFREWSFRQVAELKPDLVLMSNTATALPASGAEGEAMLSEWTNAAQETLSALAGSAGRIVVLDSPPSGKNLADCATRISKPGDCTTSVDSRHRSIAEAGRAGAAGIANVQFVDTRPWFCSPSNNCPAFVGNTTVYADGVHLTAAFSKSLGPVMAEALAG